MLDLRFDGLQACQDLSVMPPAEKEQWGWRADLQMPELTKQCEPEQTLPLRASQALPRGHWEVKLPWPWTKHRCATEEVQQANALTGPMFASLQDPFVFTQRWEDVSTPTGRKDTRGALEADLVSKVICEPVQMNGLDGPKKPLH